MVYIHKREKIEKQLALNLGYVTRYERKDLIVSRANCAAIALIDQWPAWYAPVTVLVGAKGSGKSHIANIWAEVAGAVRSFSLASAVEAAMAGNCILLENLDANFIDDEVNFFHLLNVIQQNFAVNKRSSLFITAYKRPAEWNLKIADLISRLRVINLVEIGLPDDVLLRGVLLKLLSDRQLIIDPTIVEYIVRRVERSLFDLNNLVDKLDKLSLQERRAISKQMVGALLLELNPDLYVPNERQLSLFD